MNLVRVQEFLNKRFYYSVHRYNHKRYWKLRAYVAAPPREGKIRRLIQLFLKVWRLYQIKKMDGYNNASTGASLDRCVEFCTSPDFRTV
ncbi:MAG: hypothetical protein J6K20_04810 [Thermoguttaceae bacterium]|nr:hypothetical protein [Thermoguttaceae bacterium]